MVIMEITTVTKVTVDLVVAVVRGDEEEGVLLFVAVVVAVAVTIAVDFDDDDDDDDVPVDGVPTVVVAVVSRAGRVAILNTMMHVEAIAAPMYGGNCAETTVTMRVRGIRIFLMSCCGAGD